MQGGGRLRVYHLRYESCRKASNALISRGNRDRRDQWGFLIYSPPSPTKLFFFSKAPPGDSFPPRSCCLLPFHIIPSLSSFTSFLVSFFSQRPSPSTEIPSPHLLKPPSPRQKRVCISHVRARPNLICLFRYMPAFQSVSFIFFERSLSAFCPSPQVTPPSRISYQHTTIQPR